MFAYLVHNRDQWVHQDTLIETLWPNAAPERRKVNMYSAVYQIRKLLQAAGLPIVIENRNRGYRAVMNGVATDVGKWEKELRGAPALHIDSAVQHVRLSAQYEGDYFGDYDYVWAEAERERLRMIWQRHALRLGAWLSEHDRLEDAILLYQRLTERFPLLEEAYFMMMKLHYRIGNRLEVNKWYRTLIRTLQDELGAAPGSEVSEWYESIHMQNNRFRSPDTV